MAESPAFAPDGPLRALIARVARLARDQGAGAYVVGGAVRDVLLGRRARDLDIAVAGDAVAFARRIAAVLGGRFVELDGENGVARIVLDEGDVRYIDVAQLRGALQEDLRRRDFTIDALAVPLEGGRPVDVCGGLEDLRLRLVRMNSPSVFVDDPLRLLRGARIASELGFEIEPGTEAEIVAHAPALAAAGAERRRDELARIFALEAAYQGLRLLDRLRLLDVLLPEVTSGRAVEQPGGWHAYDVFEHNMHAVEAMDLMLASDRPVDDRAWLWDALWSAFGWRRSGLRACIEEEMTEGRSRASLLKLAALLHDVAKPQTRVIDAGGQAHFYGHADQGAALASKIMRRLRFSTREAEFVATLVREHLRPVQLAQIGEAPTRRALYRFYRALGDAVPAVLLLALADAAASRGPGLTSEGWRRHVAYMDSLLVRSSREEGIVQPPRLLTGHDIMSEFGLSEGPRIGSLLESLREAQAAGEVADREQALAFVRSALERAV